MTKFLDANSKSNNYDNAIKLATTSFTETFVSKNNTQIIYIMKSVLYMIKQELILYHSHFLFIFTSKMDKYEEWICSKQWRLAGVKELKKSIEHAYCSL